MIAISDPHRGVGTLRDRLRRALAAAVSDSDNFCDCCDIDPCCPIHTGVAVIDLADDLMLCQLLDEIEAIARGGDAP